MTSRTTETEITTEHGTFSIERVDADARPRTAMMSARPAYTRWDAVKDGLHIFSGSQFEAAFALRVAMSDCEYWADAYQNSAE